MKRKLTLKLDAPRPWNPNDRHSIRMSERMCQAQHKAEGLIVSRSTRITSVFVFEGASVKRQRKEGLKLEREARKDEPFPVVDREIYFKIAFENDGEVVMSFDDVREKYPQLLIDYLLNQAVWVP